MSKADPPSGRRGSLGRQIGWTIAVPILGGAGALTAIALREAVVSLWDLASGTGLWWAWPIVGALAAGWLIHRFEKRAGGEGVPEYIRSVNKLGGDMRWTMPAVKAAATLLTVGSGGSGGLVGPSSIVGGGSGSVIGKWLKGRGLLRSLEEDEIRLAAICGFAGALSGLFKVSFAGGIFAAEILYATTLRYKDIFPATAAGVCGYLVTGGIEGFSPMLERVPFDMRLAAVLPVVLTGILASGAGICFVWVFKSSRAAFGRAGLPLWVKPGLGAVVCVAVAAVAGKEVLGLGERTLRWLAKGESVTLGFAAALLIGKAVATAATVGSRGSGGITFPLILMGAALGHVVAAVFGIDDPGMRVAFVATGVSGLLSASLNVPFAGAVFAAELFGISYLGPAVIGAMIGFETSRRYLALEAAVEE